MAIIPEGASFVSYAVVLLVITSTTLTLTFRFENFKQAALWVWRRATHGISQELIS